TKTILHTTKNPEWKGPDYELRHIWTRCEEYKEAGDVEVNNADNSTSCLEARKLSEKEKLRQVLMAPLVSTNDKNISFLSLEFDSVQWLGVQRERRHRKCRDKISVTGIKLLLTSNALAEISGGVSSVSLSLLVSDMFAFSELALDCFTLYYYFLL
ncbi:hypothetical protein C0J52_23833, partial [Blattella germanica]